MKRFLIFAYDGYYPSGGASDLQATADTMEEADAIAEDLTTISKNNRHAFDDADIIDTEADDSEYL